MEQSPTPKGPGYLALSRELPTLKVNSNKVKKVLFTGRSSSPSLRRNRSIKLERSSPRLLDTGSSPDLQPQKPMSGKKTLESEIHSSLEPELSEETVLLTGSSSVKTPSVETSQISPRILKFVITVTSSRFAQRICNRLEWSGPAHYY